MKVQGSKTHLNIFFYNFLSYTNIMFLFSLCYFVFRVNFYFLCKFIVILKVIIIDDCLNNTAQNKNTEKVELRAK